MIRRRSRSQSSVRNAVRVSRRSRRCRELTGAGSAWCGGARRRTTRSNVSRLTGNINRRAKFAAGRPPRGTPRWCTIRSSRDVRLAARGATPSASCSAKIRRWHAGLCSGTSEPRHANEPSGRAREGRATADDSGYAPGSDGRPHSGQAALVATARVDISNFSASVVTASMTNPEGVIPWKAVFRMASSSSVVRAELIQAAPRLS